MHRAGFCGTVSVLRTRTTARKAHPTQKPVRADGVVPKDAQTVPTRSWAAAQLELPAAAGQGFTGIERERKYFDIACERIAAPRPRARYCRQRKRPSLCRRGCCET
jgi:hypothetical protein